MSNIRKKYSNAQNVALLSQVSSICPLCSEPLFYKKSRKTFKSFEIAHIYPLNPTAQEKVLLEHEERLSDDVNDENNVIPLCEICHGKFDKPRTVEEYRKLFEIKKRLIERSGQEAIWKRYAIEEEIGKIIESIYHDPSLESLRVCRRLIILRELANEQEIKIFPRSPRACSSHGFDIGA